MSNQHSTVPRGNGYATSNAGRGNQSTQVQAYHMAPNCSMYQSQTCRYTPSSQAFGLSNPDSNSSASLGDTVEWTYQRIADLGGVAYLVLMLPGLANVVYLNDASNNDAICEIMHPDIVPHYRATLGTSNAGRAISETNPSFRWTAHDGSLVAPNSTAKFVHTLEGQPYWTPNVGYHCQIVSTLNVGGPDIDTRTGLHAAAWAEVNLVAGKRMGAMVGGSDLGSIRLNKHLELKRRSMRHQVLFVPFSFSFCLSPEAYLPLPAVQFHEIKIQSQLRGVSKLICNGSSLGATNSYGTTSKVTAQGLGLTSSVATEAAPFEAGVAFDAASTTTGTSIVKTVVRYAEASLTDKATNKGNTIAVVSNTSWFTAAPADRDAAEAQFTAVANSNTSVQLGHREIYLQGEERASMLQGGYDIPFNVSQGKTSTITPGSGSSSTQEVNLQSFTNSIEALYLITLSSNALAANHFNGGRTWDPMVEEYTSYIRSLDLQIHHYLHLDNTY